MALLDITAYDLNTTDGQADAIDDLIGESNSQFDRLNNVVSFAVQAYTQLTVNLVNGQPTGTYQASYNHGLGFPPAVLAYFLQTGQGFYAPLPYDEAQFDAPPGVSNTYQYFTVDETNVYFNVFAVNNGGAFSSTQFSAAFYIFNLPLGQ